MPHMDDSVESDLDFVGIRKKGSLKKLTRQSQVESENRREMLKQESKDSGIVTEMAGMSVRPKDSNSASPQPPRAYQRSETGSGSTKNRRSLKSKNQSEKIKRSQSVKVKRTKVEPGRERSHDDLEVCCYCFTVCLCTFVFSGTWPITCMQKFMKHKKICAEREMKSGWQTCN